MPGTNGRESLQKLYTETIQDLWSAEEQILEALPKMLEHTKHAELKRAFQQHFQQTEQQGSGGFPELYLCAQVKPEFPFGRIL